MNHDPKLLHRLLHTGSVKDIYEYSEGELLFRFSDRYSIFDWGHMPDLIPEKGKSLATMGDLLLTHLKNKGIHTHYVGRGTGKEDLVVKRVNVPRERDAELVKFYEKRPLNTLIPLEVIYRFGVPKGSSLLKKFPGKYKEGEEFSQPLIDFTTKLEPQDRPLSIEEAKKMSGMNDSEWKKLSALTLEISSFLKSVFQDAGLKLWDGKFEFAFGTVHNPAAVSSVQEREIMLVDSIGMDEIRLTFEGQTLSKELLRQHYLDSSWFQALSIAKEKSPNDFRNYCVNELHEQPQLLPAVISAAMSRVYQIVNQLILNADQDSKKKLHQELSEVLAVISHNKARGTIVDKPNSLTRSS